MTTLKPPLHKGCACTVERGEKKKELQAGADNDIMLDVQKIRLEAQQEGGRHHGKYLDAMSWKEASVKKAVSSYRKTIEEHKAKIQSPEDYDAEWNFKDERARRGLIRKWEKDLKKNGELEIVLREVAAERGIDLE